MSAFLVDAEHINVMLWAAMQPDRMAGPLSWYFSNPMHMRQLSRDNVDDVGQMLINENAASVNFRYSENEAGYVYQYRRPRNTEWSLAELLNAIHCYEYQACERSDWKQSEAYAFCRALEHRLINNLPGYREGPWEITPSSEPAAVVRKRTERTQPF